MHLVHHVPFQLLYPFHSYHLIYIAYMQLGTRIQWNLNPIKSIRFLRFRIVLNLHSTLAPVLVCHHVTVFGGPY